MCKWKSFMWVPVNSGNCSGSCSENFGRWGTEDLTEKGKPQKKRALIDVIGVKKGPRNVTPKTWQCRNFSLRIVVFVLLKSWDAIPRMEFRIPRMEFRIPRVAPRIPRNSPRAPRMAFSLRERSSWNLGASRASDKRPILGEGEGLQPKFCSQELDGHLSIFTSSRTEHISGTDMTGRGTPRNPH